MVVLLTGFIRQPHVELCLFQVGIVDWAPKVFSRKLDHIIGLFLCFGRVVARLSRFGSLIRLVGKPWACLKKFEKNILAIRDVCSQPATKVIFVEIAKPDHFLIDNCVTFLD